MSHQKKILTVSDAARHRTWRQMALVGTPTKGCCRDRPSRWIPRSRTLLLSAPKLEPVRLPVFDFPHRRCSAGQPRASSRSERRPGLSDGIDRHAESVRPFSSPSRTLSACKSILIPHPRAALAARACPGLPCHAPSVRKRFRAWRSRSKNLSAPQPVFAEDRLSPGLQQITALRCERCKRSGCGGALR